MKLKNLTHWLLKINNYLAGQLLIKLVDFFTAIIVLRALSITEYALYIIAGSLLTVGSMISDLGLSQAIITLGSKHQNNLPYLGSLINAAKKYRQKFYLVALILVTILMPIMTKEHGWNVLNISYCLILILISNWFQQNVSFNNSILNIHHDSKGLFNAGMVTSLVRLILTITLCRTSPQAVIILLINLIGVITNGVTLSFLCKKYISEKATSDFKEQDIKRFIMPLIPGITYFTFQGNISTFFLTLLGTTKAVAQFGALGRLGQIIGFVGMLNPFFIQPYFARLTSKKDFFKKCFIVIVFLIIFIGTLLISSYTVPDLWLLILGNQYSNLKNELPVAILAGSLSLCTGVLYFITISRSTKGQAYGVLINLTIITCFVFLNPITTVKDGFLLNILVECGYILLEIIILSRLIATWKK